eukprot:g3254.t1
MSVGLWWKTHGFDEFGDSAGGFCGYSVDYAKSSKAGCKKCKQKIQQGMLRIGTNFYGQGDFIVPHWRHYKCHGAGNFSVLKSEKEMEGYDDLTEGGKQFLAKFFAGKDAEHEDNNVVGTPPAPSQKPKNKSSTKKKPSSSEDALDDRDSDQEQPTNIRWKTHGFTEMGDSAGGFYGYSVDYAKSSKAVCRKCKCKIQQGMLRIGTNFYGEGDFTVNSWRHYKCHGAGNFSLLESEKKIDGYHALKKPDKEFLAKFFAGDKEAEREEKSTESKSKQKKKKPSSDEDEAEEEQDDKPAEKPKSKSKKKSAPPSSEKPTDKGKKKKPSSNEDEEEQDKPPKKKAQKAAPKKAASKNKK